MRVLVTGSNGRIGRFVVRELAEHGHQVIGMDISPSPLRDGTYIRANLTYAGEVYQAVARSSVDAVVHLGAWANAGLAPDGTVYGDNVRGTYNLFQACADLGVKNVLSASTNQIYGLAGAPPAYVPVDESHPFRPVNCYALSKIAGEQAADYFNKQYGMRILSFRFMGVRAPEEIAPQIEAMEEDPASGAGLLWTRTDARDAASACRLAIEADDVPVGAYNITSSNTVLQTSTMELIDTYFGDATKVREPIQATASPLSIAKAEAAFGYKPRYIWKDGQYHL